MKFKLDENLGRSAATVLFEDGHDVATVHEQKLSGRPDPEVIAVCHDEGRCLVTLDVEFGNPLLFVPSQFRGIALIRLPQRPSAIDLISAVRTLADAVRKEVEQSQSENPIDGMLWVVQPGRVRVYQQPDREE